MNNEKYLVVTSRTADVFAKVLNEANSKGYKISSSGFNDNLFWAVMERVGK